MKIVSILLAALSLAACTAETEIALPYDAYFLAVSAPYASPDDCIANSPEPRGCRFAITLCADGRAAQRIADIISTGTYEVIDSVAHASFADGTSLEFDVATRSLAGDSPNTTWIVDTSNLRETLQFDTIDCSRQ
jgi:hypothetical protein